ncbi:endonuclease [Candidatus Falkowbacteria bacterium CG_4_10_14_0_2_um_filter_41_15]|uniref:Endonuclease n=3 Tax=Candidatus Falkowiibacteriota TaxID=1752728 RepID=A0A2G9ZPV1_9BACT|nr:MAG: endonuclease [Candidatus Falkowbacteria bacterium CG1_02_41_21]PIP34610.1 MAG: endonuclease [Candidatus Falkowbacteria bacterium CG23_combo_of_CG06-09_8_20_14_all_41_10]PJA08978.1 MAG: endonuclease [Candidatus Falkowbacteria bacterium CG_4_10_14_0_2_um_filter_41_15]
MTKYYLYILKCSDRTLYTGITTDLDRRLQEHNGAGPGAKYTNGRRPVKLMYSQEFTNRSEASKEEARIKKLPRRNKLAMIKLNKPYVKDNQSAK